MDNSWIKETTDLLEEWERQKEELRNQMHQIENELIDLEHSIIAGHDLIEAYRKKHGVPPITISDFNARLLAKKSYSGMLLEIAQKRQGYLKASDAVELLYEAGVSKDKKAIQANVYSALGRSDKFEKIVPGEYRIGSKISKSSQPSGVREAVKSLVAQNPKITKGEVLNQLIHSDFDFKGKKPQNAVNITWAYLFHDRDGEQAELLSPHV